ncbi:30652_t:CDS:10 [Gigaspora margarita]|uniref:30652_t:CDS:1 n=1 Tax=Gigaspora margarita TaxID=4874 RepID=A0ABM8VZ60_GIGMA|nr:30652_t:CDS:10 [Gigaspora margarita]
MKGKTFKPGEPYTHRLNKILDEYPDGSQILREILQNSDDSKSHRYQGPALLSRNDAIFEDRDFQSLLRLADSEKRDQFDKIGAMGVGFNSIYHITDSPSFITGDQYVILDPHDWYFDGGIKYDFIDENIVTDYPDQLTPFINSFGIPCDKKLNGTIFRYPLRTVQDAIDSEISKNEYDPTKILNMFDKFYENESINCLLFLKSVESIKFLELKENDFVPKLLYSIEIVNAKQIRKKRGLVDRSIGFLMKDLGEKKLSGNTILESVFVVTFRQQKFDEEPKESQWIIFSWLGDLNAAATYFNETFKRKIVDYKLIPNVGIAVPLNDPEAFGRLFCFLPLPILLPFRVSLHGHFAVSTNRRSLWSATDGEDLAEGTLAKLKVSWNQYLFNVILPQAWAKFLVHLPIEVPEINVKEFYSFWPIIKESGPGGFVNNQSKNLLLNTIENFKIADKVFCGPPKSCSLGNMSGILPSCQKNSSSCGSFHLLSIENGFLPDESANPNISKIIENIGFPLINIDPKIYVELKKSHHKDSLNICSPHFVRMYLHQNKSKWENIKRDDIISLFEYVLKDQNYTELDGLTMIPLSDGTFGTIIQQKKLYFGIKSKSKSLVFYIGPDYNNSINDNDERNIFVNSLNKFIDKNIPSDLWNLLYKGAQGEWDLNIKILIPSVVANMITSELSGHSVGRDEIPLDDSYEWIFKLWNNLKERDYDLNEFEEIHLLPTNSNTLRKLKTNQKCFWNNFDNKLDNDVQPLIEKFGIVFVDKQFEKRVTYNRSKLSKYVIGLENLTEVLTCLSVVATFPKNVQIDLQPQEVEIMINYLRCLSPDNPINNIVKYLPIFSEVGKKDLIAIEPRKRTWYLLPSGDEKNYGKIIAPNTMGFLDTSTPNKRFLLESIIKVQRLSQQGYWTKYVIPYLGSQTPETIEIVIIKLFERLQLLLSEDPKLKFDLGNLTFIPASTIRQKEKQETHIELKKPTELYDPENHYISGLFFDDECLFPARNFSEKFRDNFLTSLKVLGMKSYLSPLDIIQRLDVFAKRKKDEIDIVHKKSLKLVQYIDKNYDKLSGNNNPQLFTRSLFTSTNVDLSSILQNREWIPTVDSTGKKQFSKANECRSNKYKNLVGLVMPIIEYSFENKYFIKNMQWDSNPPVDIVIAQLKACSSMELIHENTSKICEEIYKYMNDEMNRNNSNLEKFKEELKDEKWIFCNGKFYSSYRVVIELDKNLGSNNSSVIVELPFAFKHYKELFKEMGVRQKISIPDLINIIKEFHPNDTNTDTVKTLSSEELHKVVSVIELIANRINEQNSSCGSESLKDLLVPSTECQLVNLYEIYYDDMKTRLDDNEKNELKIVHSLISYSVAKTLGMKMLAGKFIDSGANNDYGEVYEQNEQLAVRISNIIRDYSVGSIFNEFLQNADDAGARKISFIIDERDNRKINKWLLSFLNKNADKQNSLLSDEMNQWQGPALWIYNDAEFTPHDFDSLKKLGMGGKKNDKTKIGRFGIGFNCAYHLTDLPSFVSGEHIVFFDPLEKFLPKTGNPPRSPRGTKINFIEKDFKKRFEDQASTYAGIFGCEFKEKFNGTLFRLPLRTNPSELSIQTLKSKDLKSKIFDNIKGSREMLFLRNIEQCNLFQMNTTGNLDLIWEAKIQNMNDEIRELRISNSWEAKLYQLEMEMCCKQSRYYKNGKCSEIWLICNGGDDMVDKSRFRDISKEVNLLARGGVASLLAMGDGKSLKDLKSEMFSNVPTLNGKVYSYLSLPMFTSLGVHINGTFCLSSDRKNVLQADSDLLTAETKEGEWNRYILLDVLPPLHSKLLEHVANQLMSPFNDQMFSRLWPMPPTSDIYREYGLNVLRGLYLKRYKVFWTEANGGALTSFDKAYFVPSNDSTIADILIKHGIEIVKLSEEKMNQINEMIKKMPYSSFKSITPNFVCSLLRYNSNILDIADEKSHELAFQLLNFILQGEASERLKHYKQLNGLRLLPLCDKSLGTFGSQTYYIADQELRKLFPRALSKFVADPPLKFDWIFKNTNCCNELKIKSLDANSIIDLLEYVLERDKEIDWKPHGEQYPNKDWHNKILSKFTNPFVNYECVKLARYPILSTCIPPNKLVLPDCCNPLLMHSHHPMVSLLARFEVRFTDTSLPFNCHPFIKNCILQQSAVNMIKSLEYAVRKSSKSLQQLFAEKLSIDEVKRFRSFIKDEVITGQKGIIPPRDFPFFSIQEETNIFLVESDTDFHTLFTLGAKYIEPVEYVKEHLNPLTITLDQQYIDFLKGVLSLEKREIENYLSPLKIVPNYHLSELVKANTLYDLNESLFRRIFWNTNKLLHPNLQANTKCLNSLKRMGLKYQVNTFTFLECVREIDSRIRTTQLQQSNDQMNLIKSDARFLMEYLYERMTTLHFSSVQWVELLSIKFVPVDTDLESPLKETAFVTTGFESINSLCCQEYKLLCWTQCPLFLKSIDPPNTFKITFPNLFRPSMSKILDNLCYVALDIFRSENNSWKSPKGVQLILDTLKETYKTLDNWLKTNGNANNEIISRLRTDAKIFLNGNDPFIPEDWVAGENLVFGAHEDVRTGLHKVHDNLKEFKLLLKIAGAREIKNIIFDVKTQDYSQKDKLLGGLLDSFEEQNDTMHHDVVMKEATEYQKVIVDIDDIEPSAFRVLIRWLHGQKLEEAISAVFKESKCSDVFLVDLLKASDKYQVDPLKDQVEVIIIKGCYVNIDNVIEFNEWAEFLRATQLNKYCQQYIKENKSLVIEKKICEIANATNEEDKRNEEDMLNTVLDS